MHLLAGLVATATMAAAGTASANRFSVSSLEFRLVWTPVTISDPGTGVRVECNLTLEGRFHQSTTPKTPGQLLGFINRATLATPCTGGEATILVATLPWHVAYEGFTGTLPAIATTSAALVGASIAFDPAGALGVCLMRTERERPLTATAVLSGSSVTAVRLDETDLITATGAFLCSSVRARLSGSGRFTTGGGGTFRITLV
jgi:hypothetical protein